MRDYVNCSECGMTIDSDFAISSKDSDSQLIFFCSEKHKSQWHEKYCDDCGQLLDALHMSDIDPKYCGVCADKRIEKLQEDISETTLVLWEGK